MALYKYTFAEVIQEICSRVNDPDRDTYVDRAKELFYESAAVNRVSPLWNKAYSIMFSPV